MKKLEKQESNRIYFLCCENTHNKALHRTAKNAAGELGRSADSANDNNKYILKLILDKMR